MTWQQAYRGALPPSARDTVPDDAPAVTLGGTVLFRVTQPIGPYTKAARAEDVTRLLDSLVLHPPAGGYDLTTAEGPGYTDLMLGRLAVHRLVDADTVGTGLARATLAQGYRRVLSEALTRASAEQRGSALDRQVGVAGAITLLLLLAFAIGGRLVARTQRRLERLRDHTAEWETMRHLEVVRHISIIDPLLGLLRVLKLGAFVLLLMLYVPTVLGLFRSTAALGRRVGAITVTPVLHAGESLVGYLPRALVVLLALLVLRYVLRLVGLGFRAIGEGQVTVRNFPAEWAQPTSLLVRVFLIASAFALVFPYLPGAHSDGVRGVSIFLGLLLSWGSSSAVGNIIAGAVLIYTRAFRIGDRVAIAGTEGDVIERTLLVTRLRTIKHVDVTIPNGVVLSSTVQNFSTSAADRGLVLHTTVTLGYDLDWREVHRVLVGAALATPGILATPAPYVLQTALNDFSVSYQLNAHTDRPEVMHLTQSALHASMLDACRTAGIEILTPDVLALRRSSHDPLPATAG